VKSQSASRPAATTTADRIEWLRLSLVNVPLRTPASDAKVLTGRQRPLERVAVLLAEMGGEAGIPAWGSATRSGQAVRLSSRMLASWHRS